MHHLSVLYMLCRIKTSHNIVAPHMCTNTHIIQKYGYSDHSYKQQKLKTWTKQWVTFDYNCSSQWWNPISFTLFELSLYIFLNPHSQSLHLEMLHGKQYFYNTYNETFYEYECKNIKKYTNKIKIHILGYDK